MSSFGPATTRRGHVGPRRRGTSTGRHDEDLLLAQQAPRAQSGGARIPAAVLAAVQRTAGNAAAVSMARGRQHRSSHSTDTPVRREGPARPDRRIPVQTGTRPRIQRSLTGTLKKQAKRPLKALKPVRFYAGAVGKLAKRVGSRVIHGKQKPPSSNLTNDVKGTVQQLKKPDKGILSMKTKGSSQVASKLLYRSLMGACNTRGAKPRTEDLEWFLAEMLVDVRNHSELLAPLSSAIGSTKLLANEERVAIRSRATRWRKEEEAARKSAEEEEEAKENDPMERIAKVLEALAEKKGAMDAATSAGAAGAAGAAAKGKRKAMYLPGGGADANRLGEALKAMEGQDSAEVADTKKAVDKLTPAQLDELWPWLATKRKGKDKVA